MNLARGLALLTLVGLGSSLAACGSSSNGGTGATSLEQPGGGTGNGTGNASAKSLIDAVCTALHGCCVQEQKPSSKEACVAFYTALNAKVGANAAQCEAYVRQHTGDGTFCKEGLDDDASGGVCDDALSLNDKGNTPKRKLGETCDFEDDCAVTTPGAEPDCLHSFTNGATTTACIEIIPAAAGEACVYSLNAKGDRSQTFSGGGKPDDAPKLTLGICKYKDGLFCDGSTSTCKPIANIGEPCTGFDGCVETASCQYEQGSSKQICVARAAVGEACTNNSSTSCVEGAACKDKVCVALKVAGEACGISSECASSYCKDSKCEGNGGSGTFCFTAN